MLQSTGLWIVGRLSAVVRSVRLLLLACAAVVLRSSGHVGLSKQAAQLL